MGFTTVKGSGAERRIDTVVNAIGNLGDKLKDVDVQQQEVLNAHQVALETHQDTLNQLDSMIHFTNNRVTDVGARTKLVETDVAHLLAKPFPMIPDIKPIRVELQRIRVVQDELLLVQSRENKALWDACKDLKFEAIKIRKSIGITLLCPIYATAIASPLILELIKYVSRL